MECICGKLISRHMRGRCMQYRYKSMGYQKKCAICGKPFYTNQPNHICCSRECSYKHELQRKSALAAAKRSMMPKRKCLVCGKEVTARNRQFCSAECNNKWYGSAVKGEKKPLRLPQCQGPPIRYVKPAVIQAKEPAARATLKCDPCRLPARGFPSRNVKRSESEAEWLDDRADWRNL